MPPSELPTEAVASIAAAVARATNLHAAFEVVVFEVLRVLGARSMVFERHDAAWVPVAGALNDSGQRHVPLGLATLSSTVATPRRLDDPVAGPVTAMLLTETGGTPVAIVLGGDWTAAHDALSALALVMSFALHSVRDRQARRRAERLLVGGYAMARRLSRLDAAESAGQRIVDHVARMLDAERVSLAVYRQAEDCLVIDAAHGYPMSAVEDVRIQPGAWVIGHVYSSGRPVFVRDVRLVGGMARDCDHYRTFSFAAVPLAAGSETIGVLTVTDKRDGSAFGRQDEMVLRTLGVAASVALVAARTNAEVSRLAYAATIDFLTGLLNRPFLDTRLHQEVERTRREANVLAVLMTDIDDFKTINDTWGHQVGDAVLQAVGGIVRSAVRVFDVCARYGGDEFAILMPNCDRESALICAERIRAKIAEHRGVSHSGVPLPRLTMSIGVAVMEAGDSPNDLLLRADQCLYQAKADGKNLVRAQASGPEPSTPPRPVPAEPGVVLTPRAIDTRRSPEAAGGPDGDIPHGDLPYVLVADANPDRIALCLESVEPFKLGLLIARDGDQAARLLERFGPPILLIVDLSLKLKDGVAVIETLRGDDRARTDIIAWSASREIREFASSRLRGLNVRVLGSGSSPSVMRAAIERVLERHATAAAAAADTAATALTPEEIHQAMADLSGKARHLCHTPGVAVYLGNPGTTQFRASFTWASDDLIPHSPYHLPRVFDLIRGTGDVIRLPDLTATPFAVEPGAADQDAVQGLVAVPVLSAGGHLVGAICVFDVQPFSLSDRTVSALEALGRSAFSSKNRVAAEPLVADSLFRDRASDDPGEHAASAPPKNRAGVDRAPTLMSLDWPPSLLDRAGGEFAIARELARARRERCQLSVVLFDISPASRQENRPATALSADDLLDGVADTLLRAIRQSDLPIRWGGRELLVVLPGLAGAEARTVAERVRAALQAGSSHRLAVSGGVAELEADERFGAVVDRARQKVDLALGRGHNRVI